ncbi:hypothetical protein HQN59_13210 [Schlegelella sp. ID0723]|uniref:Uncharacterized protein n=1 Tax=Piscinibacter koreensis TaxID=2742824 RepID=A0A7Y6NP09_9BURK|nr:hypothetical protein [Schlegelella koreensis]
MSSHPVPHLFDAEQLVDRAIRGQLLPPSQRDWALALAAIDPVLFSSYLRTAQVLESSRREREQLVDRAIRGQLLLPLHRDWALALAEADPEGFSAYLRDRHEALGSSGSGTRAALDQATADQPARVSLRPRRAVRRATEPRRSESNPGGPQAR